MFKVGDRVRLNPKTRPHEYGDYSDDHQAALKNNTVLIVHALHSKIDVRFKELNRGNWSVHPKDLMYAKRKPIVIIGD